jgi:archaellum biogenesis protein FlaJ (TadC family)
MEEIEMDGTITPAAELASEADRSDLFMSENKIVHPDWTQMMESYDRDYKRQVASVNNYMQRYCSFSTSPRNKD